jgi:hypothetical protein
LIPAKAVHQLDRPPPAQSERLFERSSVEHGQRARFQLLDDLWNMQ